MRKVLAILVVLILFFPSLTYLILANLTSLFIKPLQLVYLEELPEETIERFVSEGRTVIKFFYGLDCNCEDEENVLKEIVKEGKGVMILNKVLKPEMNGLEVEIKSLLGKRFLKNPGKEELIKAVCELSLSKPSPCFL